MAAFHASKLAEYAHRTVWRSATPAKTVPSELVPSASTVRTAVPSAHPKPSVRVADPASLSKTKSVFRTATMKTVSNAQNLKLATNVFMGTKLMMGNALRMSVATPMKTANTVRKGII